jgi:hypothetical protein
MSCTRQLSITINPEPEDMPLDQAIYDSSRDVIFAVRGGYIYKLNSSTGASILSARFASPAWGDSHLCLEPITDRIYATVWFNYSGMAKFPIWQQKFIYRIIPDTLGVETFYQFDNTFWGGSQEFREGPRHLFAAQGKVYGMFHRGSGFDSYVYEFDPGTGLFNNAGSENTSGQCRSDLVYDSVLDAFWAVNAFGVQRWDRGAMTQTVQVNLPVNNLPTGVAYRSDFVYCTMQEFGTVLPQEIKKKKIDDTGATTTIDMGDPDMIPFNIKYNPVTDRFYVPTMLDDTVVVIDPNTDTVESVKTGFDSPYDIVFTPTKSWAVQHGPEGLKEIV